jgi:hypothetical protein
MITPNDYDKICKLLKYEFFGGFSEKKSDEIYTLKAGDIADVFDEIKNDLRLMIKKKNENSKSVKK